ncbi:MAG: hypothetical protein ACR2HV_04895 [Acidimicrobiales bacterium]
MEYLAFLLGPLGCVVAMGICMAMMARGRHVRETGSSPAQPEDLTALQSETAEGHEQRPEVDHA